LLEAGSNILGAIEKSY